MEFVERINQWSKSNLRATLHESDFWEGWSDLDESFKK